MNNPISKYQDQAPQSSTIYKPNQINTSVPLDRHQWLTFGVFEPSRNVGVLTPAVIDQCAFCHTENARPSRQASYPPQQLGTSQSRPITKSKETDWRWLENCARTDWHLRFQRSSRLWGRTYATVAWLPPTSRMRPKPMSSACVLSRWLTQSFDRGLASNNKKIAWTSWARSKYRSIDN